ncbi:unnamed protein product [Gordionus sp. m RMFG-2023]|uniref:kelch-like protein 5 n=1 Tax=Gordionus sp. m RMFG-2023 TaxID=3053472 RepID=UPI0030E3236B
MNESSCDELGETYHAPPDHVTRKFRKMRAFRASAILCDVQLVAIDDSTTIGPAEGDPANKVTEGFSLNNDTDNSHSGRDFTIQDSPRKYVAPAHKLVLASCSDYFAAMFGRAQHLEANQYRVEIGGVESAVLSLVVDYMYSGFIEIKEENVEKILSTANLLQLPDLVQACCNFLIERLNPLNCCGIRAFADSQCCSKLYKISENFIIDNFLHVVKTQEFLLLPFEQILSLLRSEELNITHEESVFKAMMNWVRHDVAKRGVHISQLMGSIKLSQLSPQFIGENVEMEPLLNQDPECQKLIMEALIYNLLPSRKVLGQNPKKMIARKGTIGTVYAIGGMDISRNSTGVEIYDYRKNEWTKYPTRQNCPPISESNPSNLSTSFNMATSLHASSTQIMPPAFLSSNKRLQFGAVYSAGKIYLIGGRDGLKTLSSVECYDMRTSGFRDAEYDYTNEVSTRVRSDRPNEMATNESCAGMITPRHGLGVATLGGLIYAVGGHDGWSYLNTVERYDPQAKTWSFVAQMNLARSTVSVVALDNKLYAIGGRDGNNCLRSCERYDLHRDKWCHLASMAEPRGSAGTATVAGHIYVAGGHKSSHKSLNATFYRSVERYDPQTDTWTTVNRMKVARDAVGLCSLGQDRILAVGGYDGFEYLKSVEIYDPYVNQWTEVAPLKSERAGTCLVCLPPEQQTNCLYRIQGENANILDHGNNIRNNNNKASKEEEDIINSQTFTVGSLSLITELMDRIP